MKNYIKINNDDTVAVALTDLKKGNILESGDNKIVLLEDIPCGYKIALKDIHVGEDVIKYGFSIGHASKNISAGAQVHIHNLATNLGENLKYIFNPIKKDSLYCFSQNLENTFMGFERTDGRVGIRNELWIIPTVGCVNMVAKTIERRCQNLIKGSIDAVVAFNHPYGCSQMGDDQENTRRILANLIKHPNAGGVLVLGLGCENSNIEVLKSYLGDYDKERIAFLVCQDVEDEIESAINIMNILAQKAMKDIRTNVSISKLTVGLKCGGSDGLSGITANPTVGIFSDFLINMGGTTILTEVPEMFGAETILMNRAKNESIFNKIVNLIQNYKDYFRKNNQTIYENPSPGNKAGGISTLEDKALGCTQKSGSSQVVDVLEYAECIKNNGLNLLSSPGNDLVASTALAASGAQVILFTTGRGTPFASPVPTLKLSTNSLLAKNKANWIDFNCEVLIEDNININELGKKLYEYVLETANGKKTKSELAGYHDIAIFKQGVTL